MAGLQGMSAYPRLRNRHQRQRCATVVDQLVDRDQSKMSLAIMHKNCLPGFAVLSGFSGTPRTLMCGGGDQDPLIDGDMLGASGRRASHYAPSVTAAPAAAPRIDGS